MEIISNLINEMELPLAFDKPTIGGGNCGFHALIQQGRRPNVHLGYKSHLELRAQICNFGLTTTDPQVLKMKAVHDAVAKEEGTWNWDQLFQKMKKKGEWMDGPILPVAAVCLGHNINVISPKCNQMNPC